MELRDYTKLGRQTGTKRCETKPSRDLIPLSSAGFHVLLSGILEWAREKELEVRNYGPHGYAIGATTDKPREEILFSDDRSLGNYEEPDLPFFTRITVKVHTELGRECYRRFFCSFEGARQAKQVTFDFMPVKTSIRGEA